LRITPGVRLEPPALDRLHQRCPVTSLTGLFERRIQNLVVPLEDVAIGAEALRSHLTPGHSLGQGWRTHENDLWDT
jgi:hypothetical protein